MGVARMRLPCFALSAAAGLPRNGARVHTARQGQSAQILGLPSGFLCAALFGVTLQCQSASPAEQGLVERVACCGSIRFDETPCETKRGPLEGQGRNKRLPWRERMGRRRARRFRAYGTQASAETYAAAKRAGVLNEFGDSGD